MDGFPGAGFTAGPCLLKDTLQLAAGSELPVRTGLCRDHVNEGLPAFVVDNVRRQWLLEGKTVGLLGMSFKAAATISDRRSATSFRSC